MGPCHQRYCYYYFVPHALVECSADVRFCFAVIVSREEEEGDGGGGVKGTTLTAFTWVVVVDDFMALTFTVLVLSCGRLKSIRFDDK